MLHGRVQSRFALRPENPDVAKLRCCKKQLRGFKIDRYLSVDSASLRMNANRTISVIGHFAKHARHLLIGTSRQTVRTLLDSDVRDNPAGHKDNWRVTICMYGEIWMLPQEVAPYFRALTCG